MKKTHHIVFLLALALIMLAAIPATAGPAARSPAIIETPLVLDMPSFSAAPAMPTRPIAENTLAFSASSIDSFAPFVAPASVYAVTINRPTIYIAIMATLAALVGLGRPSLIVSYHRVQKASDRLHGLARDQDALA